MAKAKSVKKKKKTVEAEVVQEQQQQPEELSEEQVAKLMVDLDDFQNKFLSSLARTDKFEIIPTADEHGTLLSQEQLSLIRREVNRLGLTTIYAFDISPRFTILMCATAKDKKLKIGMISNGSEVH